MSSFFSEAEKIKLANELNNVAQTFERPICMLHEAQKLVISTNINFNRFEANEQNPEQNPINIPISYTGMVRIQYDKLMPTPYSNLYVGGNTEDAQLKIKSQEGKVRLKVNNSGANILKDAKLIELDGTLFSIDGAPRQHGLFGTGYTTFILKREQ